MNINIDLCKLREKSLSLLRITGTRDNSLTSEKSIPTKGEYIGYKSLPNGMFYYSSFRKRAIDRILSQFESDPSKLIAAAKQLGGGSWEIGDYSVRIPVLPRIDVIVVFYEGDDEFPPDANMLFNDKIINFLDLEDIVRIPVTSHQDYVKSKVVIKRYSRQCEKWFLLSIDISFTL
ncbi:MAG TPA: DUF3786 domain-containing protein [Spirochaetales bacterium]|nr:DUF3786 domain-containing protein [Spirochaetales bacterium]